MLRRWGRTGRGKSSEATGKFSLRARRATDDASMAPKDGLPKVVPSNAKRLLRARSRWSNRGRRVAAPPPLRRAAVRSREPMAPGNARDHPVAGVSEDGEAVILRLTGELDLYNAPELRKALVECAERNPKRLVVDLGEVTFVDSTALGALIEARALLGDKNGLVLASPGLETRRALAISGLDRHFEVRGSVEEALEADG